MAVSAVVGLVTAAGGAIAAGGIAAMTFFGLTGGAAFAAMFAVGAGVSMLSRALIPKPDLGAQMRGTTATVREPAGTRKIIYGQSRVGGNVVFIHHSGDDNKYLHLVVVFATHEIQSYEEIWFNDNKIWDGGSFQSDWGTYVTIDVTKKGTATQTASNGLVNDVAAWTTNHKLSGIAYITFKLEWNQDKFPQGVPNITAVIKGKKVYDPRLDSTVSYGSGTHRDDDSSTWTYSSNPALCVRDYLTDSSYGLGEAASTINLAALKSAADYCDATQQGSPAANIYSTGAKRFECSGRLETGNQIKSNIEQLLSSMGGRITYSGGEYFIDAAEYRAPTVTIDETVITSPIKIQTKQSRRSIYNGVKGTFISEEKNYKVLDYPAQISSTYATEDGDPIFLDMPLPFVSKQLQAQALAKIALLKSRQQVVISMTVNLAALKIKIGDTISVNYDKLGYSGKVFEVIGYELKLANNGEMGVQLECIETASSIYDWTTSDEEDFLSGGELDLYDGRTVDNVDNLTLTEIGLRGPDGGVSSAVQLTWDAPDDAFIEYYKIRYNKNGTTDYFEVQSRETNVFISGLDITSNYDFRVQAENLLGVTSTGTTLSNQALNGDTTAPGVPTSPTATGGVQTITCEWNNPSDIDYAFTEVHVVASNSQPADDATPTAKISGEEYVVTGLSGAVTKHFFLRAVDFSGNKSAYTSGVSGTSVQVAGGDIEPGEVQGKTLALLLNKTAEGNTATGEGALVGVNLDGTPNLGSDGSIIYNGSEITIEHNQYASGAGDLTIATQLANKRGYIVFDINKTKPFQMSGALGNWNCAFVHLDTGVFYYDNNSATRVSFNPSSFTGTQTGTDGTTTAHVVALGVLETSTADNILAGGLYGEPRDLVTEELPDNFVTADAISVTNLAAINADLGTLTAGTIDASVVTVSNLQADNITGDVSEHFTFNLGRGFGGASMGSLTSGKQTFDVEIPAPSGGVAKRPYIQGVAIADTNDVTGFDFNLEVRLKTGKSYTHDFVNYQRAETAPFGTSNINYNVYSGNQVGDLTLGGVWTDYANNVTSVYGFFYDESADESYLLFDDDEGDFQNGDWALTPGTSTSASSNLCLPEFGAPANGEEHTVPFLIILPETTVATTFMLTYSGSGFLRGLNGEAGYLR